MPRRTWCCGAILADLSPEGLNADCKQIRSYRIGARLRCGIWYGWRRLWNRGRYTRLEIREGSCSENFLCDRTD